MPEVVMNVIIPPNPTPPLQKKQVVKTVNFLPNPKTRFWGKIAQAGKSYETLQIPVNLSKGKKAEPSKNKGKTDFQKTYQRPNVLQIPVLQAAATTKKQKDTWQLEEEKRVNNRLSKEEML